MKWLVPIAFAAVLAIRHIWGDSIATAYILGRLSPLAWVALALLLAILSFAMRRAKACRLPFAIGLVISLFLLEPAWNIQLKEPGSGITVITLNMQHGLGSIEGVANLIKRENPEILCLQESGPLAYYPKHTPAVLADALRAYKVFHTTFELIAVKGEIKESAILPLPSEAGEGKKTITMVRAKVKDRNLRIATVHFSPRGLPERGIFGAAAQIADVKAAQTDRLLEWVHKESGPTIVCGDFNGHPVGRNYRKLTSKLKDAFAEGGFGLGYTINSKLPHKRIDYIFVRDINVASCNVLSDVVSDHKAVKAYLY